MTLQRCPDGWTPAKLALLNDLVDTAQALNVLTAVIAAAGDNTARAATLKADLVALAKTQLAALKAAP